MVWIRASLLISTFLCACFSAFAQESLWKTVNGKAIQEVPSYSGGLSPFPQRQKKIEEITFDAVETIDEVEEIEEDGTLTDSEKAKALTTSILARLKEFLANEIIYIPDLSGIVVDAIAKANGKYIVLIDGEWLKVGDSVIVPVNEAREALALFEELQSIDPDLALTVEDAVLDRTEEKTEDKTNIIKITHELVVFEDSYGQTYDINFIAAPY